MEKRSKPFPQLTTTQPTNPSVCDLYDILDRFHADIHTSIQEMTEDEDAESFDICQELISTYTRRMSMAQWIRVLGELVVGMYLNQGDNAARSQSTAFTAIPA
jgi:hypothetical protein